MVLVKYCHQCMMYISMKCFFTFSFFLLCFDPCFGVHFKGRFEARAKKIARWENTTMSKEAVTSQARDSSVFLEVSFHSSSSTYADISDQTDSQSITTTPLLSNPFSSFVGTVDVSRSDLSQSSLFIIAPFDTISGSARMTATQTVLLSPMVESTSTEESISTILSAADTALAWQSTSVSSSSEQTAPVDASLAHISFSSPPKLSNTMLSFSSNEETQRTSVRSSVSPATNETRSDIGTQTSALYPSIDPGIVLSSSDPQLQSTEMKSSTMKSMAQFSALDSSESSTTSLRLSPSFLTSTVVSMDHESITSVDGIPDSTSSTPFSSESEIDSIVRDSVYTKIAAVQLTTSAGSSITSPLTPNSLTSSFTSLGKPLFLNSRSISDISAHIRTSSIATAYQSQTLSSASQKLSSDVLSTGSKSATITSVRSSYVSTSLSVSVSVSVTTTSSSRTKTDAASTITVPNTWVTPLYGDSASASTVKARSAGISVAAIIGTASVAGALVFAALRYARRHQPSFAEVIRRRGISRPIIDRCTVPGFGKDYPRDGWQNLESF